MRPHAPAWLPASTRTLEAARESGARESSGSRKRNRERESEREREKERERETERERYLLPFRSIHFSLSFALFHYAFVRGRLTCVQDVNPIPDA